jgi:streptomycin 6-kinase
VTVATIARYAERWRLSLTDKPFETPSAWLAYGARESVPVVLKIPKPGSDEHNGGFALAQFGNDIAVRVLEHDECGILMERAVPGTTLANVVLAGHDDEATHVICDLIERLPRGPIPPGSWKTVPYMAIAWDRYRKGAPHPLLGPYVDRAEKMYLDLCRASSDRVLLHGDLHHMNILRDTRGWLIIDPKGVVGDPAYEVAMALHNPVPHFEMMSEPKVLARRVRIFSERLKISEERVLQWCFAVDILCHLWTVEDHMDTSDFPRSLQVADTALALLGSPPPNPRPQGAGDSQRLIPPSSIFWMPAP